MTTTLVRGRWIFPAHDQAALDDCAVVVSGGIVLALLPWTEARDRYQGAPVLGSETSAIMPGFINAHHHGQGITAIQSGLAEDKLEPWLLAWAGARDRDRYLDTVLSGARLLSTGVTTTVDMWSDGGDPETYAESIRAARRGYAEAGIRVAFAPGVKTQSHIVWGTREDARFFDSLPNEVRRHARSFVPNAMLSEDDYFAVMDDLIRETARDPKFSLWYQFPGPQWVGDRFMQRVAECAAGADTGFQTHVDELIPEKLHGPRFYGVDTMVHLERLGVLGPRLSIAHGVWLTDEEIAAMARTNTALSHNPGSNLRLFAGAAPLAQLHAAGLTIGLAMDATTLDDDEDMFAEMRLALRLSRDPLAPETAPSVADIFGMATAGGARLLRREKTLGKLLPGYAADLVVLDLDRLMSPWVAPECDPLTLVILRAQRRDVRTVMVGGEVVFAGGRPTRFDIDAAGGALAELMASRAFPSEGAAAVRAVTPHLRQWYAGWDKDRPPADPRVSYNSES